MHADTPSLRGAHSATKQPRACPERSVGGGPHRPTISRSVTPTVIASRRVAAARRSPPQRRTIAIRRTQPPACICVHPFSICALFFRAKPAASNDPRTPSDPTQIKQRDARGYAVIARSAQRDEATQSLPRAKRGGRTAPAHDLSFRHAHCHREPPRSGGAAISSATTHHRYPPHPATRVYLRASFLYLRSFLPCETGGFQRPQDAIRSNADKAKGCTRIRRHCEERTARRSNPEPAPSEAWGADRTGPRSLVPSRPLSSRAAA